MDETLIHCNMKPFPGYQEVIQVTPGSSVNNCEIQVFNLNVKNNLFQLYVSYRPYLQDFLNKVSQHFEVIVFTASDVNKYSTSLILSLQKYYADQILDKLDPFNTYFSHRLYRDSCILINEQHFIKDLNLLGRDLSKTIIVDNSIQAFAYHLQNGIPIPSFYGQHWD